MIAKNALAGYTAQQLTAHTGCSLTTARRWIAGTQRPGRRYAAILAQLAKPAAPALTGRIRAAVANLAGPGEWVSLTRLRPLLGDTPRADVDAALRELGRAPNANLVPENNQKSLSAADRAAALHRGGQDVHLIAMW
jgi:hypothetical protein